MIPERYKDVAFDRFPITEIDPKIVAATRRFVDRIDSNLDAGRGLWFMGPVGTGKTTLAMLVTKAALEAGRSAARYSLPGLLSQIRKTFDTGSHNDLLERLTAVDLLHIDDIGAEQTTPWVLEELYSIINARYEEQRAIVITTNILDRETLCQQITERTVSTADRDVRRAAAAGSRSPPGRARRVDRGRTRRRRRSRVAPRPIH